jgi:hypothetical protein
VTTARDFVTFLKSAWLQTVEDLQLQALVAHCSVARNAADPDVEWRAEVHTSTSFLDRRWHGLG